MNTNSNVHEVLEQPGHRTVRPKGQDRAAARSRSTMLVWGVLLLGVQLVFAAGEVPTGINYQGKLNNNLGQPVASDYYQVDFKIWSHVTLTNQSDYIWGRSFAVHVVSNGMFNVLLDDTGGKVGNPQKTNVLEAFEDPNRWLGLTITKVGGATVTSPIEISPRQQLVSAPYAIHSYTSKNATYASEATAAAYAANAGNATTLGNFTTNDFIRTSKSSQAISGDLYVSGKVGVGKTADAQASLDIQGGGSSSGADTKGAIALGYYADGGYRHFIRTRHNNAGAAAGNAIDFFLNTGTTPTASSAAGTNNVLTLTLDNGKAGIGTSSPDRPLSIKPNGTEWISLLGTNATPTTKWHLNNLGNGVNFAETGVSGGDGRLYLQSSGNVGIGTTTPAGKLDVNGTIKVKGVAPIRIQRFNLPYIQDSDNNTTRHYDTGYPTNMWSAAVVGWTYDANIKAGSTGNYKIRAERAASGNWEVQLAIYHQTASVSSIWVDVMFIRKELVEDLR